MGAAATWFYVHHLTDSSMFLNKYLLKIYYFPETVPLARHLMIKKKKSAQSYRAYVLAGEKAMKKLANQYFISYQIIISSMKKKKIMCKNKE